MPQSLSSVLVHLIFSTKHREPLITPTIEPSLHACMATILKDRHSPALTIGGMPDHIHILLSLSRTEALSDVVEGVKKGSSRWIKTMGAPFHGFYWQSGYGAFSIGPSGVAGTRRYIDSQREHHRTQTFQDEYLAFLGRYGIAFDERYMWD